MQVDINKVKDAGAMPAFLELAHRHYQKSPPHLSSQNGAILIIPLDLVALCVPWAILEGIESFEVVYRKDK
jgi:hypothetical protein